MSEHEIMFGVLHPDGAVTGERAIRQSDIARCPFVLLVPEHYRADGSCRCDEPEHVLMESWGYVWDEAAGRWS